jgi:hypothetical protein
MTSSTALASSFCLVLSAGALALGCASADPAGTETTSNAAQSTTPVLTQGTHVGVHGMVLFGSGTERMYLSHIPLYENPHNMQVIVEVKVDTGIPADKQLFATGQFTFNPRAAFSLGDLAAGTLTSVSGTVYTGDFENGGRPAFRNVTFVAQRVIFQRDMSPSMAANPALDYIAVGTPNQAFFVHLIDAPPSFDQIAAVKLPASTFLDDAALQAGTQVRIKDGQNSITKRLKPQAVVGASRVTTTGNGAPGQVDSVQVLGESSCMPGDQFFGDCPAIQ